MSIQTLTMHMSLSIVEEVFPFFYKEHSAKEILFLFPVATGNRISSEYRARTVSISFCLAKKRKKNGEDRRTPVRNNKVRFFLNSFRLRPNKHRVYRIIYDHTWYFVS
ncbi:hypothetical protein AVEN_164547-1 [Araneus ventricosus]|uniref:Uncharacterized protein n=1 Tax=Araneus ventricosus TaxID=182803 RepID=A0A4Y2B4Z3_ARAVE|nr:hypothetical protein AVEN_164547-1 [Araneus ventricosus]